MADEVVVRDDEDVEVDRRETEAPEGYARAVYPASDKDGNVYYTYGDPAGESGTVDAEEASFEEWAGQNGVEVPATDEDVVVEGDDDEDVREIETKGR